MVKIVIFTGDLNFSVIRGVFEILDVVPEVKKILIIEEKQPVSFFKKIKRQKFNIKKNGWRWVLHIFITILNSLKLKSNIHNTRRSGEKFTFTDLMKHPLVEYFEFTSIHSEACLSLIEREKVDLGISMAAPILKKELFTLPRLGTINLHKGKLPNYKGMPAGYWEIHNGETEVGVTVHKIVAGLDAGDILVEDNIPVYKFSTAGGVRVQLDELGIKLVTNAVSVILEGTANFAPQIGSGKLYRKPTLKESSLENKKILMLEGYNSKKEFIKKILMNLYVLFRKAVKIILKKERKKAVSILLFHRVSDEFRDNVTIGVEQFDSLIGFLAQNYQILTLKDILNNPPPIGIKPSVIIRLTSQLE
ncbi:MAG: hypothetical protein COA81_13070 [Alphaproteobacteria bacterium]|nr:MAG: hypothetical protein COA81_13070 [Alphaproteobacteria bacterium]